MTGVEVSVCDGEECQECGKFPAVENGKWGTMTCGGEGGIEGNYVKVFAPKEYLQIAQIKIHGTGEYIYVASIYITQRRFNLY